MERRDACEVAIDAVVNQHGAYRDFTPTRVSTVSIHPRVYRVYGEADGYKPLSVVVAKGDGGFVYEYIQTDHTR